MYFNPGAFAGFIFFTALTIVGALYLRSVGDFSDIMDDPFAFRYVFPGVIVSAVGAVASLSFTFIKLKLPA